jgi:hypothetical protein
MVELGLVRDSAIQRTLKNAPAAPPFWRPTNGTGRREPFMEAWEIFLG